MDRSKLLIVSSICLKRMLDANSHLIGLPYVWDGGCIRFEPSKVKWCRALSVLQWVHLMLACISISEKGRTHVERIMGTFLIVVYFMIAMFRLNVSGIRHDAFLSTLMKYEGWAGEYAALFSLIMRSNLFWKSRFGIG